MNDQAEKMILDYLNVYSEPPDYNWPDHWFDEVAFSRWAAEELLIFIADHPFVPAEDSIDEFAIRMEMYSALSDGRPASRIFSIAAETAREFLENVLERRNQ